MDAFNKVNATDETSKVLAEIEGLSSSDAVQILASKLQLWKTKQTALEAGDTSVAWSQVPLIIDALIDQIGECDKVKHPKLELLIGTAVMFELHWSPHSRFDLYSESMRSQLHRILISSVLDT